MSQIEACIFDLDGLMIDSEPLQRLSMNSALAHVGIQLGEEEWNTLIGLKPIETFRKLKDLHGFEEDPLVLEDMKNEAYKTIIEQSVPAMPGLYSAIDVCIEAHLRLALASSSIRHDIDIILPQLGLTRTFEVIISGDQVSHGKPNPEIFLKAAYQLHIGPNRCMVFEDTTFGVAAAKAAGMFCIAVPNRFTAHQDFSPADIRLNSLSDFSLTTLDSLRTKLLS